MSGVIVSKFRPSGWSGKQKLILLITLIVGLITASFLVFRLIDKKEVGTLDPNEPYLYKPTDFDNNLQLASSLSLQGKVNEARDLLEKAYQNTKLGDEKKHYASSLVFYCYKLQDYPCVVKYGEQMGDLENNSSLEAELAEAYEKTGNKAKALEWYKKSKDNFKPEESFSGIDESGLVPMLEAKISQLEKELST